MRFIVCAVNGELAVGRSMLVGFFMNLSMNDFFFTRISVYCLCNLMMFYDWRTLGTTKHSSCNCSDTWQLSCIGNGSKTVVTLGNKVVLYW